MLCRDYLELLSPYGLADELRAMAYEHSPAQFRASLKNAIAFHALKGESETFKYIRQSYAMKGYELEQSHKPAPWLLCICHAHFSSPARLCAALMPALLAQVPEIIVLNLEDEPHPAILVALELLGIEENYALPVQNMKQNSTLCTQLLKNLAQNHEAGRVLLFGEASKGFEPVHQKIKELNIPHWEDIKAPQIYAQSLNAEERDILQWAQGDAVLSANVENCTAIYDYTEKLEQNNFMAQKWAKGMEGCFVHMNLSSSFFQNTSFAARSI